MRTYISVLLSIIMLSSLCLAGCGAQTPNSTSTPESTTSAIASAGESSTPEDSAAETKTYVDFAGRTVEIPVHAERIVAVNMIGELLALGVTPVGASDSWLQYIDEELQVGIEPLGALASLNLEKIVELNPDLIITPQGKTSDETLAALEKIAPTVVGPAFGDAIENLQTVAEITDRTEEAKLWMEAFNAQLEEAETTLATAIDENASAMVIQFHQGDMYVYPTSTFPVVYNYLGFVTPSDELDTLDSAMALSLEALSQYDPDYIFVTKTSDEEDASIQEAFDGSIWQQLSAAQNDHVYIIGSRLSSGDVLSIEWSLGEIQSLLTAA